jgi:hypothetical protein
MNGCSGIELTFRVIVWQGTAAMRKSQKPQGKNGPELQVEADGGQGLKGEQLSGCVVKDLALGFFA